VDSDAALEAVVDGGVEHSVTWSVAHTMKVNRIATKVTLLTSTSDLWRREDERERKREGGEGGGGGGIG